MTEDFTYVPYEDPALKEAREHLKDKPPGQRLPPGEIACVDCPRALGARQSRTVIGDPVRSQGPASEAVPAPAARRAAAGDLPHWRHVLQS